MYNFFIATAIALEDIQKLEFRCAEVCPAGVSSYSLIVKVEYLRLQNKFKFVVSLLNNKINDRIIIVADGTICYPNDE